jgi:hypothetical protein
MGGVPKVLLSPKARMVLDIFETFILFYYPRVFL